MYINYSKLKVGDRLIRQKGGIFTKHHAVYVGYDYYTKQYIVAENQIGYGVRYITLRQFLREGRLTNVKYNNFPVWKQQQILNEANKRVGSNYDLVFYNCETFANDITYGKKRSLQIENAVAIGAFGLVLGFAWLFSE